MKKFYKDPYWWGLVFTLALAINIPFFFLYFGDP